MLESLIRAGALIVFGVSAAALTGCAGQVGSTNDPAPATSATAAATESLTITEEDAYHVAGTYSIGSGLVSFTSVMSTDGVSTVTLTINGATITLTADLFAFAGQEVGGGNTLMVEDLRVLHSFEKYLEAHGRETHHQARPWERLFKAVSMYASAPSGYTILERPIVANPKQLRDGNGRDANTVSDEGIIYMCVGASGHDMFDQADWAWAEHDSVTSGMSGTNEGGSAGHWRLQGWEPGGCYLSSLTSYTSSQPPSLTNQGANSNWDGAQDGTPAVATNSSGVWTDGATYNDSQAANVAGNWTGGGSCEGRCGAGCPQAYNWYWTKDCFDHDICLDYHTGASSTSSSGDCGFEFQDAQGDWIYGSSSSYQDTYCGNVPYGCTENGNSQSAGS